MNDLVIYESPDLKDIRSKLQEAVSFKELTINNIEVIDAIYRAKFPDEVAELFDLEVRLRDLQFKYDGDVKPPFSEVKETRNERRQKNKNKNKETVSMVKSLYRKISKLCHPDSANKSNSNYDKLIGIFPQATEAYIDNDVLALRLLLSSALDLFNFNKDVKEPEVKDVDHYLVDKITNKIKALNNELNELLSSDLHMVLVLDRDGNDFAARILYKNILSSRRDEITSLINFTLKDVIRRGLL